MKNKITLKLKLYWLTQVRRQNNGKNKTIDLKKLRQKKMDAYSISKFGNLNNSGGRFPDRLLLSRRLQNCGKFNQPKERTFKQYRRKDGVRVRVEQKDLKKSTTLHQRVYALGVGGGGEETYKWTRFGNPDNSDGISPLIELLFMWLSQRAEDKKTFKKKKKLQ